MKLNKISESILYQGDKPFRWEEARKIEIKYLRQILLQWQSLEKELFELLPVNMPPSGAVKTTEPHDAECRCGGCLSPILKAMSDQEAQDWRNRMAIFFDTFTIDKIVKLFKKYLGIFWEGGPLPNFDGGIFQQMYSDAINEGNRKAYIDTFNVSRRAGRVFLDRMAAFAEMPPLSNLDPITQQIFNNGFELVTSKMTKYFLPEAFKTIVEGLEGGVPWNQIAINIRKKVGSGAGWHWRRLVRTELAGAFDKTSMNRYREFGISVVKWNLTWGGSCEICRGHSRLTPAGSSAPGYYREGGAPSVPEDTHPNCRCRKTPVVNLPEGVIPN